MGWRGAAAASMAVGLAAMGVAVSASASAAALPETYGTFELHTDAQIDPNGPCTAMGGECDGPSWNYLAWQYQLSMSGRIAIGSDVYRGDLVSETSPWQDTNAEIPKLRMRGNTDGHWVRGVCYGEWGGPFAGTLGGYALTCNLGLDGAPWQKVHLDLADTDGGYSYSPDNTMEYGDEAGFFVGDHPRR